MSIVPYEPRGWIALQNPAVELANAIAATEFVPTALRGNPAAITAAILYGDEVGIGPMQSLAKIAVIQGRPTLAAETQRALILRAGHDLWIEDSTNTKCTVAGRRKGSEQTSRVTWTLDDAKRAGIAGKQPWRQYPRQMLLARASAELARAIFADAIGGMSATEELADDEEVVEAEAPAPTRRRQRATISQPTTSVVSAEPAEPELPPLPGDEPEPSDHTEPISDAQLTKLQILFREKGFLNRAHRLAWSTIRVHRHIESSKDLTRGEASKLIDELNQTEAISLPLEERNEG